MCDDPRESMEELRTGFPAPLHSWDGSRIKERKRWGDLPSGHRSQSLSWTGCSGVPLQEAGEMLLGSSSLPLFLSVPLSHSL